MKLITLDQWAAQTYGDAAPNLNTLRRWARDARIYPTPQKHGRAYFVDPAAKYITDGTPPTMEGGLMRRLANANAKKP
jgi:hypothetical protein